MRRYARHAGRVNRDPLRLIVEVVRIPAEKFGLPDIFKERLECGHLQRIRSDWIGLTNAYRRRCKECGRELRAVAQQRKRG